MGSKHSRSQPQEAKEAAAQLWKLWEEVEDALQLTAELRGGGFSDHELKVLYTLWTVVVKGYLGSGFRHFTSGSGVGAAPYTVEGFYIALYMMGFGMGASCNRLFVWGSGILCRGAPFSAWPKRKEDFPLEERQQDGFEEQLSKRQFKFCDVIDAQTAFYIQHCALAPGLHDSRVLHSFNTVRGGLEWEDDAGTRLRLIVRRCGLTAGNKLRVAAALESVVHAYGQKLLDRFYAVAAPSAALPDKAIADQALVTAKKQLSAVCGGFVGERRICLFIKRHPVLASLGVAVAVAALGPRSLSPRDKGLLACAGGLLAAGLATL